MKKLLLLAVIVGTMAGCQQDDPECNYGFGPLDCNIPWSKNYIGSWNSDQGVLLEITKISATEIRFDNRHNATLTGQYSVSVPHQTYAHSVTGADIQVWGSGNYEHPAGRIVLDLHYQTQGLNIDQREIYTKQ